MTTDALVLTRAPAVTTGILIRRPAHQVYEAFADPAVTTRFWFTRGSGRLESGARVRWDWEMFDLHTIVTVKRAEADRRILFDWNPDHPTTVELLFTARGPHATSVTVTETGLTGAADDMVGYLAGSTIGFTKVLCAAKALLEHDVVLAVVADHQVDTEDA